MRGWLIFLACAAPVVLLNPVFWWLVGMETGASAVTYVERDGARVDALLGPKAPWPDWARLPADYRLTVRSHFASAPGHPATGGGDVELPGTGPEAVALLRREFSAAGWQVTTVLTTHVEPSLFPRQVKTCILTARQVEPNVRSISIAVGSSPANRIAPIQWREADPLPQPSWMFGGPC